MKRVSVVCDFPHTKETDAVDRLYIRSASGKRSTLDACAEHMNGMFPDIHEQPDLFVDCPECGRKFKRAGLGVHRASAHGILSTSYNAVRARKLKAKKKRGRK